MATIGQPVRSSLVTPVDYQGFLFDSDNPFPVAPYYWNPNTLSYQVGTTGGSGVGEEVKVTNFPSTYVVTPSVSTSTSLTLVAASVTEAQLLASNSSRRYVVIVNDAETALYITLGSATASSTNYTYVLFSFGTLNIYSTQAIRGKWAAGFSSGGAKITDFS